jgi:hypothetical protein
MEKLYQWEPVYTEASLMPKFQPKIMFYAVLNWKGPLSFQNLTSSGGMEENFRF